jgi:hypothetical protein
MVAHLVKILPTIFLADHLVPVFSHMNPVHNPQPHSISIRSNLILFSDLHRAVEQDVFYRSFPTKRLIALHTGK